MNKKIISFLTAVIVVFLNSTVLSYAESETMEKTEDNIASQNYNSERLTEALGLFDALKITDKKASERICTRVGFVTYALRLISAQVNNKEKCIFEDVDTDTGSVNYAYKNGLIFGDNGKFKPDDAITAGEAVLFLGRMLGYSKIKNGISEDEIINKAVTRGVLDGVNVTLDKELSFEEAIVILFNAFRADVFYWSGMSENGTNEYYIGDKKLMNHYLKVYEGEGVVNAGKNVNLTSIDYKLGEGEYVINDSVYLAGDTDLEGMIGMRIKYYYINNKTDNENTMCYAVPYKTREFCVNDIDIDESSDLNRFRYYENNKLRAINIYNDTVFVYNGKRSINIDDADIKPVSGYVRFIDNNNDGRYEVCFIENFKVVVVSAVIEDKEQIINMIGDEMISFNDYPEAHLIYNGEEIDISALSKWDVVSVAESKDGRLFYGYVSKQSVNGKVMSLGEDRIKVDDISYPISDFYKNYLEKEHKSDKVGALVRVLVNILGEAVYCDYSYLEGRLGLITRYYENEDEEKYYVNIMDREDELQVYPLAKRCKIDEISYGQSKIRTALEEMSAHKYYNVVPCRYSVNEAGEVYDIDTPEGNGRLKNIWDGSEAYYTWEAYSFLDPNSADLNAIYFCGSGTYFTYVPDNVNNSRDFVKILAQKQSNGIIKPMYAFSIDGSMIADIVLIQDNTDKTFSVGENEHLAVVLQKYEMLNEDDEVVEVAKVCKDGKETVIQAAEKGVFDGIEQGDIIFYQLNPKSLVEGIAEHYKCGEAGVYESPSSMKGRVAGKCILKEDSIIGLDAGNDDGPNNIYINTFASRCIMVYDTKTHDISVASRDDIMEGSVSGENASFVFMQTRYSVCKDIVIYK